MATCRHGFEGSKNPTCGGDDHCCMELNRLVYFMESHLEMNDFGITPPILGSNYVWIYCDIFINNPDSPSRAMGRSFRPRHRLNERLSFSFIKKNNDRSHELCHHAHIMSWPFGGTLSFQIDPKIMLLISQMLPLW